jgi:hypothetical protein
MSSIWGISLLKIAWGGIAHAIALVARKLSSRNRAIEDAVALDKLSVPDIIELRIDFSTRVSCPHQLILKNRTITAENSKVVFMRRFMIPPKKHYKRSLPATILTVCNEQVKRSIFA